MQDETLLAGLIRKLLPVLPQLSPTEFPKSQLPDWGAPAFTTIDNRWSVQVRDDPHAPHNVCCYL